MATKKQTTETTVTEAQEKAPKAKAPSAAAQTKAVQALLKLGGDIFSTVAEAVENLTSVKALEVLPELLKVTDNTYFAVGGVMARVHENSWWKDAGYESFRDYVEEECGQSYRTTMYWIAVYNDLIKSGVSFEAVEQIGWSKLKEISSMLTPENVDEWVKRADEMSLKQLMEYVKAMKGSTKPPKEEGLSTDHNDLKTVKFKVHEDQKLSIETAVQSCMERIGTEYPAVALTHICDAFNVDGGASTGASLEQLMEQAGYAEVLGHFEKLFPNVDIDVTVN